MSPAGTEPGSPRCPPPHPTPVQSSPAKAGVKYSKRAPPRRRQGEPACNTRQRATLAHGQRARQRQPVPRILFSLPQPWLPRASRLLPQFPPHPSTQGAGRDAGGTGKGGGGAQPGVFGCFLRHAAQTRRGAEPRRLAWQAAPRRGAGREGGSWALYGDKPRRDSGSGHLPRQHGPSSAPHTRRVEKKTKKTQKGTARPPRQHRGLHGDSQPHTWGAAGMASTLCRRPPPQQSHHLAARTRAWVSQRCPPCHRPCRGRASSWHCPPMPRPTPARGAPPQERGVPRPPPGSPAPRRVPSQLPPASPKGGFVQPGERFGGPPGLGSRHGLVAPGTQEPPPVASYTPAGPPCRRSR